MRKKLERTKTSGPRYRRFGDLLREARKNRKLTQGELAERLGVRQQAVSGWERGTSRPETIVQVKAIAALFPERNWMEVTGHGDPKAEGVASKPVRPLSSVLPLHDLAPERFEDFCATLLRELYPGAQVHQYGVPGDVQRGIDIDVLLHDKSHYTFQCKRVQNFGKDKVRRAIEAHDIDCDLAVILLSRPATVQARAEITRKRKKHWDLWDAKDIAERIRSLPAERRLGLVDTYFPAHRSDFLGIPEPSVFEPPEKYFAPFLARSHIFSHAWTLVGREKELAQMASALSGPNEGAMLIAGAGGSGKTRLLRTILDAHRTSDPNTSVVILPSTLQPGPKEYELIAGRASIVIIEDAHDRVDMKAVAHALARLDPMPRVIVTCRPYALSATRGDLESTGLPVAPGFPLAVSGLCVVDAESVAMEILKAKHGPEEAANQIALVAHDSPLALVIGTHLVATRRIHPRTLNNADEFRQRLLAGFRDAVTGTIGLPAEQPLIRSALELIALLQPLEVNTKAFAAIAAKLTRQSIPEITRAIQLLLEAGVIVRRARKLRIVPDLLGDYLIEEVLRREGGQRSATAQQLLTEADAEHVAHLLVNTAKLDWRLSAKDEDTEPLSNIVWHQLIAEAKDTLPEKLAEGIETAAYYQPEQALQLYDRLISAGIALREPSRVLRHVAMNMEYVERASQRLWMLAQNDKRRENSFPDHPMRVLKELAKIEPAKPIAFCDRIAEFAMNRLTNRSDALQLYEVLESGLNADGHTTESSGLSVTFRQFAVRHSAVKDLRQKIIGFLFEQLASPHLPSAVRAAAAFSTALHPPYNVTNEARAEWTTEFVSTLERLVTVVQSGTLDVNVLVAIEKSVHWHAGYGEGPAKDAANRVVSAIPQTLDYRVTLALTDAWGHTRMHRGGAERWVETWQAEKEAIAKDVVHAYPYSSDVVDFIRRKLLTIRQATAERGDNAPGQFVSTVASQSEAVSAALSEAAIADENMRRVFSASLFAFMHLNPASGIDAAKAALAAGSIELTRDVAWCLSARQGRQNTIPEERALLSSLLTHPDPFVGASVVRGTVSGGLTDIPALAAALLQVELGASLQVASEFFQEVMNHKNLCDAVLVEDLIRKVLAKIARLPTIEDFWLEKYLSAVSGVAPVALVEFLLSRIDASIDDAKNEIQPLPHLWDEKLPFAARTSPQFKEALRRIREWMLRAREHWSLRFWAPKLYIAVAGGVDDEIVRDLLEWTDTHDEARFRVAVDLLREAPNTFALDQVTAVRALFDRAEQIGSEAVADLRSSLFAATISGMRHGSPGQPFPEDVRRKTKSQEALARLPAGSPVAEFYATLARDAEGDIRRKKEEDEAMIEEFE